MRRSVIGLIMPLALSLCVGLCATDAQPSGKVARVGVLSAGHPEPIIAGLQAIEPAFIAMVKQRS